MRGATVAAKRNLLRDCCALSLLSLIPPDRVGCIRKLRIGHTLKKKPGGDWMMDLSKQRDGHKTSRFCKLIRASALPTQPDPSALPCYSHRTNSPLVSFWQMAPLPPRCPRR